MKLHAYLEQRLEALGYAARLEFELGDGSTVTLVHPWLWDNETQKAYDTARTTEPPKNRPEPRSARVARAVLGKTQYQRFAADGGNDNMIILAIELMQRSDNTTSPAGEGPDPKDA
ncbi:hypothetical protein [Mycobacterium intracellulare]|uniref:hypothetical protein n=1 Tax=Mycobacterium intracellulare TaxID=1767 RepID=UPI00109E3B7C|nr:hypothetical protein [Mycobacterium intracellulare]